MGHGDVSNGEREFLYKIRTLQIEARKQKMSHETLTRTRDTGLVQHSIKPLYIKFSGKLNFKNLLKGFQITILNC